MEKVVRSELRNYLKARQAELSKQFQDAVLTAGMGAKSDEFYHRLQEVNAVIDLCDKRGRY